LTSKVLLHQFLTQTCLLDNVDLISVKVTELSTDFVNITGVNKTPLHISTRVVHFESLVLKLCYASEEIVIPCTANSIRGLILMEKVRLKVNLQVSGRVMACSIYTLISAACKHGNVFGNSNSVGYSYNNLVPSAVYQKSIKH